jgi:hypothetical protein
VAGAVDTALERLWDLLGDRSSLFPDLAADAVLARARAGELTAAVPRLFELVTNDQLGDQPIVEPFRLLAENGWQTWLPLQQRAVEEFADVWWTDTRTAETPRFRPGEVLACLAHLDLPLVRWLHPWLDDLDGPGARHLATIVLSQLDEPAWTTRPDARAQILAWTRSEPVVIGLTLVGGVHLEPGQLGSALDLML